MLIKLLIFNYKKQFKTFVIFKNNYFNNNKNFKKNYKKIYYNNNKNFNKN